ncbi:enoyl-CoA hydratase/isomerase family protein [Nocardia transvalensis]|uniref:enoyl-CoA hydratase/isomerase family protein n=1 Tax=Nocardia transvalensis TaxID=37333 RepID=UPI001894EB3A|nr:enoyl-CoA hydratase/isomerase family protein [Nocardia transvalensis]MBF6327008.1 enoyl-CoA hydratase/isomerase family protein [Nocardia transvalensis]
MSLLITEQAGAVLTVAMNNPPFNFLDAALMSELEELLASVDRDSSVRAVVLTSAVPEVFISHYDVGEILDGSERAGMRVPAPVAAVALRTLAPLRRVPGVRRLLDHGPAAGVAGLLRYHAVISRMRHSSTVFVAALNGRALGGGLELALGCDIRVMADGPYEIGQPEILIGLLPGGGGIAALTRSIGLSATVELALEGRPLTPRQAYDARIIHHLTPPDQTVPRAQEIAARLARRSPAAVRAVKHAAYDGATVPLGRGLAMERIAFLALATRPDTRAAMRTYRDTVADYERSGTGLQDFVTEQLPRLLDGTAIDFTNGTK